jgi:hypothetical protein
MNRTLILACILACAQTATGQEKPPACSPGAICFSGKVAHGEEFRKTLNADLEFVLNPGWTIAIVPKRPEEGCQEFASVVNAPYRAHRELYIDTSYGWTAEQEVSVSPREFRFVTNCADYRIEAARLNIVLWPYTATEQHHNEALAKLGTSPLGTGRLWITGSKISHPEAGASVAPPFLGKELNKLQAGRAASCATCSKDTPDQKLGKIEWMTFRVEIKLPQP